MTKIDSNLSRSDFTVPVQGLNRSLWAFLGAIALALVLVSLLSGCAGETTVSDPCDTAYVECVSVCPENQVPGATAYDSCEASCRAEHTLCEAPPPPHVPVCIVVSGGRYECDGVLAGRP